MRWTHCGHQPQRRSGRHMDGVAWLPIRPGCNHHSAKERRIIRASLAHICQRHKPHSFLHQRLFCRAEHSRRKGKQDIGFSFWHVQIPSRRARPVSVAQQAWCSDQIVEHRHNTLIDEYIDTRSQCQGRAPMDDSTPCRIVGHPTARCRPPRCCHLTRKYTRNRRLADRFAVI